MVPAWLAGVLAALVPLASTSMNICGSASGCEFWDNDYHEYTLYEVDTEDIDVLIVPPAGQGALYDIVAIRLSIDAWESGINALGANWIKGANGGIQINRYILGLDVPPPSALQDPEIIVLSAEYNPVLLFGIGLQSPLSYCSQRGGEVGERTSHGHGGVSFVASKCAVGGRTCVVLNTNNLLGGPRRMYDLNAHEFGHCLGIGHVGDAGDFDAKTVPMNDIMSYQSNPQQVHCVSTLNVRALEGVYGEVLNQPSSTWLQPGDYKHMATSAYSQVTCINPA